MGRPVCSRWGNAGGFKTPCSPQRCLTRDSHRRDDATYYSIESADLLRRVASSSGTLSALSKTAALDQFKVQLSTSQNPSPSTRRARSRARAGPEGLRLRVPGRCPPRRTPVGACAPASCLPGAWGALRIGELTGFSPRIRRIFSSGKLLSSLGKFRSFGPYDITIGRGTRFMDVSVTYANLKIASVQFVCKLATHCRVFVQWSLAKQHLFNQVEGSLQSVGQRGRAGGRPAQRDNNFNGDQCKGLDAAILEHAKQAFVSSGIPKLHFVKSTDKDLGGWKRKDFYDIHNSVVCYSYL